MKDLFDRASFLRDSEVAIGPEDRGLAFSVPLAALEVIDAG